MEEQKFYREKWLNENPEYYREYYKNNAEKLAEYNKIYKEQHKKQIKKTYKQWYKQKKQILGKVASKRIRLEKNLKANEIRAAEFRNKLNNIENNLKTEDAD